MSAKTTFGRYDKVRKAMERMPALSRLLTKETVTVFKPNREEVMFAPEVVSVTEAISQSGKDATAMTQDEISHFATDLLMYKKTPPVVETAQAAPAVPVETKTQAPEPKPKADAAPRARLRSSRKPSAPKIKKARRPAAAPAPPEPAPAPPKAEAKPKLKLAMSPSAKNGSQIIYVRKDVPYVVGTAILTLMEGACVLLAPYIKADDPEAKEVYDKFQSFMDEVHRRTMLPNCAKDSST